MSHDCYTESVGKTWQVVAAVVLVGGYFAYKHFRTSQFFDEIRAIERKACACRDVQCANKELANFVSFAQELKKKDVRLSDADQPEARKIGDRVVQCLQDAGLAPCDFAVLEDIAREAQNPP